MIERTYDAAFFNRLCNLPEVRPGLGGEGPINVSHIVADPKNFALKTQHGGFILIAAGAGFYSVHTQFASEGRGAHALAAVKAGLDFMFTRTDAMRISSHCPDNNPAALGLAVKGGAKRWFRNEHHPLYGPGVVVAWDLFDWTTSNAELEAEGEEFHEASEKAIAESPFEFQEHPHDPIHNRAVGATVRMCRRGQAKKGVLAYNLWASAAGYPPARLISENPPAIDAGVGMVVSLNPDGALDAHFNLERAA